MSILTVYWPASQYVTYNTVDTCSLLAEQSHGHAVLHSCFHCHSINCILLRKDILLICGCFESGDADRSLQISFFSKEFSIDFIGSFVLLCFFISTKISEPILKR